MRHRKKLLKLGVPKDHRTSMLRNLVASLVLHGRIRTTKVRAKALSMRFARMMTLVKRHEDKESIRILARYCPINAASRKVMGELKKKFEKKTSGFTRITAIGMRKGDNAKIVQIELI